MNETNILSNSAASFTVGSNTAKINKAVRFLALSDVQELRSDATKAKFLKSRGLNHDEVKEAFIRHYVASASSTNQLPVHPVQLNPVAGDLHNEGSVAIIQNTHSSNALSKFFGFCQKLVLFAGIVSSFYYAYQKWARAKDAKKKSEKIMREEINHLRNELTKISNELRHYQVLERNNATLLKEVNSLKSILVGRQQFEEKQAGKVALPSWQLNGLETSKVETTGADLSKTNETAPIFNTLSLSGTDQIAQSNSLVKSENKIPVPVPLPLENDVCSPKKTLSSKNVNNHPTNDSTTSNSNSNDNSSSPEGTSDHQQRNARSAQDSKMGPQKSNSTIVENGQQRMKHNEKKN